MDNNRNTPAKANLMKKEIGRFVLYKELSKYYTADQIDQMLVDIATHGTIDLNRYVKKSEVDSALSPTSEMPVQNKVIYEKLMDYYNKEQIDEMLEQGGFVQIPADWNQTDPTKKDFVKNKPTIPEPITIDPQPTKDSPNAVSSGSVYNVTNGTLKTRYIPFDLRGESVVFLSDEDMTELFGPATMVGGQSTFDLTVGQYQHIYRVTNSKSEVFEIPAAYHNANGARKIVGINGNLTIELSFTITNGVYINAAIAKRETSIPGISYEEEQDLTAAQRRTAQQNIGLEKDVAGGVAGLDEGGKIVKQQIPTDVVNGANLGSTSVQFGAAQQLTPTQQTNAQNNMMGKAYAPAQHSGLGKLHLDKNNGVLTQSMINTANTVYVIQYDFTLDENITVPSNCVLEFEGGSITANGSADTITGNNTQINAITKIFNGIVLSGSWSNSVFHISWVDSTIYSDVQNIINYCATNSIILNLDGKKIDVSTPYNIDRPFRGSLVEPFDYKYQKKERFFTICNGIINITGNNGAFSTTVDFQDSPVTSCHIKFEKVKFMSPYSEDGSGGPQTTACVLKDTKLFDLLFEDCTFNFIKLIDNTASSKYIQGLRLINCHITECYAIFIETPSTIYYCEIVNSILEGFVHMLIKGGTLQTVVVDNCCMETMTRLVTFTNHRGISITNNYFESIESILVQCLDEVALSPNSGFNFTGNGIFYCGGSAVLSLGYELDYNIKANHLINCPQLVTFLNGHSFDQSNIATLRNVTVPDTGSVKVFLYDGFYYISRGGQFTSMISITGSELTKWLATGFDERIDLSMSTDNTLEISSKGYEEQTVIIKNLNPQEVNLQL